MFLLCVFIYQNHVRSIAFHFVATPTHKTQYPKDISTDTPILAPYIVKSLSVFSIVLFG